MHHAPPPETEVRAFAARYGITEAQARQILSEHGHDESKLEEAAKSLAHFFRAPS
jgi:hypothetical protein